MSTPLNILFLCNKPPLGAGANTIRDHIDAFQQYSEHNIWLYSNLGNFSKKLDLNRFDVLIVHYSIFVLRSSYLSQAAKTKIHDFQGLKVIFIQDEYRRVNAMVDELDALGMDVLFTCFEEHVFGSIYSPKRLPKLSKYHNLTGYIPKRLTEVTDQVPIKDRALHVGYRGRELPYWYGELARDKSDIAEKWQQKLPEGSGIRSDVSANESDRIYGGNWNQFLSSCKATLGVESGTSVIDFTGELEHEVEAYQVAHPNASFQEVQAKFFLDKEGLYPLNVISPRCFEAIALKTALVLFEGTYSNVLVKGRHYIELKKDFSNLEEVKAYLQDDAFLQNMVDVTFDEIALNPKYQYQSFITHVDDVISKEFAEREIIKTAHGYSKDEFQVAIQYRRIFKQLVAKGMLLYQRLPLGIRLRLRAYHKFFVRKQSSQGAAS